MMHCGIVYVIISAVLIIWADHSEILKRFSVTSPLVALTETVDEVLYVRSFYEKYPQGAQVKLSSKGVSASLAKILAKLTDKRSSGSKLATTVSLLRIRL